MDNNNAIVILGIVGAMALFSFATFFLLNNPSFSAKNQVKRVPIGSAEKLLTPGSMKEVKINNEESILIVRTASGSYHAMGPKCPHNNLPLVNGVVSGDRVTCYAHGACFSAQTGDIEDGPSLDRVPSYAVIDEKGELFVEIPILKKGQLLPLKEEPHFCSQAAGDKRNFVVIGAGPAAQGCAESLRREGYTGAITLLTKETTPFPYDRVLLSKNMGKDATYLRPPEFYARLGISVRTNVTVTKLRTEDKTVLLTTGEQIRYDKVLCATGGPARTFRADRNEPGPPPTPGAELGNIFPLRDIEHAKGVFAAVESFGSTVRVVIVGSSFIGMEAASYLLTNKMAADVSVIGMEDVPLERVLGRDVGAMLKVKGEAKTVKFHLNATVSRFVASSKDGRVVGSVLLQPMSKSTSGSNSQPIELAADVVIIGAGIVPATEYLKDVQGVTLQQGPPGGVKVDKYLNTGHEDVFAAGDIAYMPYYHSRSGDDVKVRIEHWDVAMDQGRVAARNMLGGELRTPYTTVPFFWTSVFGKSIRSAGYCHKFASSFKKEEGDEVIIQGDLNEKATVYYVIGGGVVSVVTVNNDPEAVAAGELIRLKKMPSPTLLKEASTRLSLKSHLAEVTVAEARTTMSSAAEPRKRPVS